MLFATNDTYRPPKARNYWRGSPHPRPGGGDQRALESEAGCEKVMHLLAGLRGATSGLMAEVVEDHVRTHLVDADRTRVRSTSRRPTSCWTLSGPM